MNKNLKIRDLICLTMPNNLELVTFNFIDYLYRILEYRYIKN